MSDHQSRTASDDLYDHERDEPRSGRRRRPVADWGVGEDMFEHIPRTRFSRAAEGPPRDRRFSRAAEADRHAEGTRAPSDPEAAAGLPAADAEAPARPHGADAEIAGREGAGGRPDPDDDALDLWSDSPRDDAARARALREEPRRWTGPGRDDEPEDEAPAPRRQRAQAEPPEGVPRGGVDDGRRTIVIGKPEDVPSEIAAITADRDIEDDPPPEPPAPARPAQTERRTVRIGGRPEGSLEAARFHRDHSRRRPAPRPHERLGARPDRIAMWAFALGLLLILIAVLTAH
jgi:hypothetical protein